MSDFTERFWENVCSSPFLGVDLIVTNLVVLVLLVIALQSLNPGSGTYAIALVTAGMSAVTVVGMSYVRWTCAKRESA